MKFKLKKILIIGSLSAGVFPISTANKSIENNDNGHKCKEMTIAEAQKLVTVSHTHTSTLSAHARDDFQLFQFNTLAGGATISISIDLSQSGTSFSDYNKANYNKNIPLTAHLYGKWWHSSGGKNTFDKTYTWSAQEAINTGENILGWQNSYINNFSKIMNQSTDNFVFTFPLDQNQCWWKCYTSYGTWTFRGWPHIQSTTMVFEQPTISWATSQK